LRPDEAAHQEVIYMTGLKQLYDQVDCRTLAFLDTDFAMPLHGTNITTPRSWIFWRAESSAVRPVKSRSQKFEP
jgi:hypothetical protein